MKTLFSIFLFIALLFSACFDNERENMLVLANEDFPEEVKLTGFDVFYAQKIIDNRTLNNLFPHRQNEFKDKNWEAQGFIYIGTYESSRCPIIIKEVTFEEKDHLIHLSIKKPKREHCTDDANVKNFLVPIDKDSIKNAKKIQLGESVATFNDGIAIN